MGQLFRLEASYAIPPDAGAQARAFLEALETHGMYLADGGSDLFITGDPGAAWLDETLTVVQALIVAGFEAVDLAPIMARPGFDPDSGRVPP